MERSVGGATQTHAREPPLADRVLGSFALWQQQQQLRQINGATASALISGDPAKALPAVFNIAAAGVSVIPGAGPVASVALTMIGALLGALLAKPAEKVAGPPPINYDMIREVVRTELNAYHSRVVEECARHARLKSSHSGPRHLTSPHLTLKHSRHRVLARADRRRPSSRRLYCCCCCC